jgi:N-acetylglucosaminyl-diphospho-decaprenol L-rhamnosyltransferase
VSVAVLIVNYRTYQALDRCLASLLPVMAAGDEVVVVDWVTDAAMRASVAAAHPAVRWIPRSDNLGFAAGVNLAAAATHADTLLLLNPDTQVEGPVVRALEAFLLEHRSAAVAGPLVINLDGSVQPSARRFPGVSTLLGGRSTWLTRRFPNNWFSRRNLVRPDAAAGGATGVDWLAGSCFATPRAVFTRLGGLDESFFMYWEDADYCRRATAIGLTCHYVPTSTVRHTVGLSSAHNAGPSIRAFHQSAFRLYWKHTRLGRAFAPVVWLGLRLRGEVKALLR